MSSQQEALRQINTQAQEMGMGSIEWLSTIGFLLWVLLLSWWAGRK